MLRKKIHYIRIFWSTVIVVSLLFGIYLLAELLAQFLRVPFQITVGRPEQLMAISYPGITICHPQTVVNHKAKQFVEKLRITDGYSESDVLALLPTALGVFTENKWGPLNGNQLGAVHEILRENELSVLDAVRAVSMNCSDFLRRCSFNKKGFPCFQHHEHLTFRQTMTLLGVCCTFNFNPTNSSYQPLNVNSYGVRGGLSIIASSAPHTNEGESGLLLSNGFILKVHSPDDFSTEADYMTLLGIGKVTLVGVYPTISTASTDVIALPLATRKCLTGNDVGLNMYSKGACATKCMTQFIYEKCECHPHFLPAMDDGTQIRDCAVTDGECFQRIYYEIKKVRCRECLPACDDVQYKISAATVDYNFANVSINPIYDHVNLTRSELTAHIYFASSTVSVKRTIISQSFTQLLSNFGGVFNLALGVSIFSILELFYYFCYKIPQLMRTYSKVRPVITTIEPTKVNFK